MGLSLSIRENRRWCFFFSQDGILILSRIESSTKRMYMEIYFRFSFYICETWSFHFFFFHIAHNIALYSDINLNRIIKYLSIAGLIFCITFYTDWDYNKRELMKIWAREINCATHILTCVLNSFDGTEIFEVRYLFIIDQIFRI